MTREPKLPGPEHPITIEASPDRVTVRAGDVTLADTTASLILREASYPPVRYIPVGDVAADELMPSAKKTYCPYKGEASYWTVAADAEQARDAVWFYEEPYPAVAPIAGHVAFYPDRVQITIQEA